MKKFLSEQKLVTPICAVITAVCAFLDWVAIKMTFFVYSVEESYSLREIHDLMDTVNTSLVSVGINFNQLESVSGKIALFWILSWAIVILQVGTLISYVGGQFSAGRMQQIAGGVTVLTALGFLVTIMQIGSNITNLIGSSMELSVSPKPVVLIVLVCGIVEFCTAQPDKETTRSFQEIVEDCITGIKSFFKELRAALPIIVFGVIVGGVLICAGGTAVLIWALIQYPLIYILQKIAN